MFFWMWIEGSVGVACLNPLASIRSLALAFLLLPSSGELAMSLTLLMLAPCRVVLQPPIESVPQS
jgi:hypothetical protein